MDGSQEKVKSDGSERLPNWDKCRRFAIFAVDMTSEQVREILASARQYAIEQGIPFNPSAAIEREVSNERWQRVAAQTRFKGVQWIISLDEWLNPNIFFRGDTGNLNLFHVGLWKDHAPMDPFAQEVRKISHPWDQPGFPHTRCRILNNTHPKFPLGRFAMIEYPWPPKTPSRVATGVSICQNWGAYEGVDEWGQWFRDKIDNIIRYGAPLNG